MEIRELTCINCPLGCHLVVEVDENQEAVSVTGNNCGRGVTYAKAEVKDPRRVVTSTVAVEGGKDPVCSVKTLEAVPKDKIFNVMAVIQKQRVKAPIHIGDVVVEDVAKTGIPLVATQERVAR